MEHFNAVIIGDGPAAIGPLVAAARVGKLRDLLRTKIAIVGNGNDLGVGKVGTYQIRSNSPADDYLESLEGEEVDPILRELRDAEATQIIEDHRGNIIPLPLVGAYLREIGTKIREVLEEHPESTYVPNTNVRMVQLTHDGIQEIMTDCHTLCAKNTVLAVGATQTISGIGVFAEKTLPSDFVLKMAGIRELQRRLREASGKHVAIIGGSHSAFSCAWVLLNCVACSAIQFPERSIEIFHRHPIKLFYPTTNEAAEDGYCFREEDVCPITGRVHRFGGLRGDAKALYKDIAGGRERRVILRSCDGSLQSKVLEHAAVIILAIGYSANTIPILDVHGEQITLSRDEGGQVNVDAQARIRTTSNNCPLEHVYGIGLGYGIRPTPELGGEPGYTGRIDGVNLYHGVIGKVILDHLLSPDSQ